MMVRYVLRELWVSSDRQHVFFFCGFFTSVALQLINTLPLYAVAVTQALSQCWSLLETIVC